MSDENTNSAAETDDQAGPSIRTMPKKFYSLEEVSSLLAIPPRTVLAMEKGGEMPRAVRFTKRMIRFPIATIDEWLEELVESAA